MAPQRPEWKDKEPYRSVIAGDIKGAMASGEKGLFEMLLVAQSGMSTDAFIAEVSRWIAQARDPRFKRSYDTLTYQPMLEVLQYLRANGFKTYIVSGGTVEFMRAFAERTYGIPPQQVLGTRQKLAFEVKGNGSSIQMLPQIEFVNDKAGKPENIEALLGRRPIAAFGNSDGDFQMLEWATAGAGARLAILLHHDDAMREFAYDRKSAFGKLDRGLDEAGRRGWSVVSMKNDWARVFPDPRAARGQLP